jgi:hypothetical protein
MTTMQAIGVGWKAARQAARQHRAERRTRTHAGGAMHHLVAAAAEHGLAVAGLGCFTAAAAMIAAPLGLVVAGIAFFVIELRAGE